jgi:hypothetical protein
MIDAHAIRRLEAMDIPVWQTRAPKRTGRDEARPAVTMPIEDPSSNEARPRSARIRLEAGSGRWLLVIDDADRARHATLIEDIRATLGAGDCRFGTWSDSPEAGVAMEDWDAHGIRHALVFSGQPAAGFVQGGELAGLTASGEARRALWRQLKPLLAD